MTSETTIAELPWWDLAEVAAHDAEVFGPTAWTLRYYWSVKAQNGTVMLAARTEPGTGNDADQAVGTSASAGELVGWIVMSAAGGEADVMTIATTEAARGKGIGRALLLAGLDWARERGAEVVHLEVDERNFAALALYSSLGFEEWGRRPDYYPGAAAVLMRARVQD
ncbi:GNAT family N-acetyltransferase [Brevibacterium renqingii]|uniref:GNAT family N-acetyltransferase n=1 Tax=Brevibacterium renqingii TaxID=2776916 RepID=UPI001AE0C58B|nr:GNAT family N-acetyltransferase [Brevibacterium renqingii]